MGEVRRLPMFPLGTVLFPSGLLPLHLFEERYRRMIVDLLEGDREFGVVLIRRGSEVGGGDERCDVGTRARVLEAHEAADGCWSVVAVGLQRLYVHRWLPDDPYPWAEVRPLPDVSDRPVAEVTYRRVEGALRRLLGGLTELGEPVADMTFEVADDPALGTLQLAALAPITVHDRQRLLECDRATERVLLLEGILAEAQAMADFRLGGS
ncbi:MAG: LON peptidase substrate-binding domain-containing protein [Actinomycetota bacterium]|nr:LON peptidase substrate-binding domain-containing protein [Actinomycetota bacterium]